MEEHYQTQSVSWCRISQLVPLVSSPPLAKTDAASSAEAGRAFSAATTQKRFLARGLLAQINRFRT